MVEFENEHLKGKSLEQLVDDLGKPVAEPRSTIWEMYRAAIDAKIAERWVEVARLQSEAADKMVTWGKLSALATAGATLIALVALLVAVL